MKPGPAISTDATLASPRRFAAMLSASSRGFLPASFASTIAALVAMSPWVGSRGGSTTMRERSAPGPRTATAACCTRARMSSNKCWGLEALGIVGLRLTQFGKGVKIQPRKRPPSLPNGRSAIDDQDLPRRDSRLVRRQVDRHVGHVNRQAEAQQMCLRELLDVLRTFEQLLDAV